MFKSSRTFWIALLLALAGLAVQARSAAGQPFNVNVSLNVYPTSNADVNAGGTWGLYAKTNATNGIASILAFLTNINEAGISYGPGINAATNGGNPWIVPSNSGTPAQLLYYQDLSVTSPPLKAGVGTSLFNSGPDSLGDPTWDTAALIAKGSYSGNMPVLAPVGFATESNVFAATPLATNVEQPMTTTSERRVALSGDYNLNDVVDAADYVVWRNDLGSSTSLRNDGTDGVKDDDYIRWRANFATVASGSGAAVALPGAVPEPGSALLLVLAFAVFSCGRPSRT